MAEYLARRPMTVNGRRIPAGERVPLEEMAPERQRQLIEHGYVCLHKEYRGAEPPRRKER